MEGSRHRARAEILFSQFQGQKSSHRRTRTMAQGSQHTLQIMETQTRFDLNAAIAEWQEELAGQPDLTPVVRRELETHLRDTVTGLQGRGLSNEESFWLARRRVGRPQELSEEFAKADPAQVWRERVFWMAVALIVIHLWGNFLNQFNQRLINPRLMHGQVFQDILPGWVLFYLPNWVRDFQLYNTVLISLQL